MDLIYLRLNSVIWPENNLLFSLIYDRKYLCLHSTFTQTLSCSVETANNTKLKACMEMLISQNAPFELQAV